MYTILLIAYRHGRSRLNREIGFVDFYFVLGHPLDWLLPVRTVAEGVGGFIESSSVHDVVVYFLLARFLKRVW